jgi:hypothetical protein
MGLTTWKNSPHGKVLKSDAIIAKNYLNQDEMTKLDRLVNMFIDFAELRALNRQVMTMKDWLKQVEKFLNYTDQQWDSEDRCHRGDDRMHLSDSVFSIKNLNGFFVIFPSEKISLQAT